MILINNNKVIRWKIEYTYKKRTILHLSPPSPPYHLTRYVSFYLLPDKGPIITEK